MDIRHTRRPSGAEAILEPVPSSHAVTIGFWFPLGSGIEAESERGYTHFLEHMLFKGTEKRDARTLARQAERAGGYLNAFTERSMLCLHCTLPADRWRDAVELLGDMAFHSVLDPEDLEREREVVHSEVLAARDDHEEDAADEFHGRIWPGHPLARRVAGEPEDVLRASRDDLYRFYRAFLTPDNLTVTAAGNFDPGVLETALDSALAGSLRGIRVPSLLPPGYRPGTWTLPASTGQVYLVAGMALPPDLTRETLAALDVLTCAFGESSSSRLFQNIREARGLCYSIGSAYASAPEFGVYYLTAVCSPSNFPSLWDMIRIELDALKDKGFEEEEVSEAVAHIHGQDMVASDDTEVRMRALARQRFRFGRADPYEVFSDQIFRVDLDQVNTARQLLFESPMSVLAYGRIGTRIRRSLGVSESGDDAWKR